LQDYIDTRKEKYDIVASGKHINHYRLMILTTFSEFIIDNWEIGTIPIIAALVGYPKLLLLDEPSLGLAPILVEAVFEKIEQIREQGTTVLLVEQNARAALSMADRGYVLEVGHIALEGSGQELLRDERVRKAYLGGT